MKNSWKMRVLCALFAVFLAIPCGWAKSVLDRDFIIVGTEGAFPPFNNIDPSGEIVGLDIDLARLIGEKLDREIRIVPMAFDALIPSLKTGKIDIILAGMSSTPERAKEVAFSRPYYTTPPDAFIVRKDSDIQRISDLQGKIVAAQATTTQAIFIANKKGEYGLKDIREYAKTDDPLREVVLGRVDVAFIDGNTGRRFLRDIPEFSKELKLGFRQKALVADVFCAAMPKDDDDFVNAVNKALEELEDDEKFFELRVQYDLE